MRRQALEPASETRSVPSVAVIGTGEMSTTIAERLLDAGLAVTLHGASGELLDEGLTRLNSRLDARVRKGEITRAERDSRTQLVCPTCWYVALSSVDILVVCDEECEDSRSNVLSAVERVMKRGAILATTGSSTLDDVVAMLLGLADALECESFE